MDGKKVDPFLLQLYKEGTTVLVPPANTLNMSPGGYGDGGYYYAPPFKTMPAPERKEDNKPSSDRGKE